MPKSPNFHLLLFKNSYEAMSFLLSWSFFPPNTFKIECVPMQPISKWAKFNWAGGIQNNTISDNIINYSIINKHFCSLNLSLSEASWRHSNSTLVFASSLLLTNQNQYPKVHNSRLQLFWLKIKHVAFSLCKHCSSMTSESVCRDA